MEQILAIQPLPAQTFEETLGTQDCTITLRQLANKGAVVDWTADSSITTDSPTYTTSGAQDSSQSGGLFMDLSISGSPIISGKYCNDRVNLVRAVYLGFSGWLYFADTTGAGQDPYYTGLGSRYLLVYESY